MKPIELTVPYVSSYEQTYQRKYHFLYRVINAINTDTNLWDSKLRNVVSFILRDLPFLQQEIRCPEFDVSKKVFPEAGFSVTVNPEGIFVHTNLIINQGKYKIIKLTVEFYSGKSFIRPKLKKLEEQANAVNEKEWEIFRILAEIQGELEGILKPKWLKTRKITASYHARSCVSLFGPSRRLYISPKKPAVLIQMAEKCLFDLVKTQTINRDQAIKYAYQLAKILNHTFHLRLRHAHLDITLENVLLINDECKLIDFGFAQPLSEMLDIPRGKAGFIPPECYSDGPYDPAAIDVWMFGLVFYQLLMFRHTRFTYQQFLKMKEGLFEESQELFNKLLDEFHNTNKNTDDSAMQIIVECFQKDPKKRIKMDKLEERLRAIL